MNCKICDRKADEGEFCALHLKAYENITNRYSVWRKALKISWKEYLNQIAKNSLTGTWVKEVTNYLIENGETRNVRQS
ncbi:MAG TPA: hypothetical protein VJ066_02470 [Candidatus Bathyarchaeia archaeon]|nr:hypothetical protein [Candidatus Bathyarchaeia archaeon]